VVRLAVVRLAVVRLAVVRLSDADPLAPFDLNDAPVMHDDLDGAEAKPAQRRLDGMYDLGAGLDLSLSHLTRSK
jgi:hypothetical protein